MNTLPYANVLNWTHVIKSKLLFCITILYLFFTLFLSTNFCRLILFAVNMQSPEVYRLPFEVSTVCATEPRAESPAVTRRTATA